MLSWLKRYGNLGENSYLWIFALCFGGILFQFLGAFEGIWIFPNLGEAFGAWLIWLTLDLFLAIYLPLKWRDHRFVLWGAVLLYFTSLAGEPVLGVLLVSLPMLLWVAQKQKLQREKKYIFWILILFLLFSHQSQFLLARFLSVFIFFRAVSWYHHSQKGITLSFLNTLEYFLSPIFLLMPSNASFFQVDKFSQKVEARWNAQGVIWILQGAYLCLVFSCILRFLGGFLHLSFVGKLSQIPFYQSFLCAVLLIFLFFIERMRTSYLAAGYFKLLGYSIEPDFSSPWRAKDLWDFFGRFQTSVHSFILNIFYPQFFDFFKKWMPSKAAHGTAFFMAVFLGLSSIFYLYLPGAIWAGLLMGLISSLLLFLHYLVQDFLQKTKLGYVFLWLSLGLIVWVSYPLFFLGWHYPHFLFFLR